MSTGLNYFEMWIEKHKENSFEETFFDRNLSYLNHSKATI
jgi:hypothetical protein